MCSDLGINGNFQVPELNVPLEFFAQQRDNALFQDRFRLVKGDGRQYRQGDKGY
jgi:hypothetical protein